MFKKKRAGRTRPAPAGAWHAIAGSWTAVLRTTAVLAVAVLLAHVSGAAVAVGPFEISVAGSCEAPPAVVHVPAPDGEVAPNAGVAVRPVPFHRGTRPVSTAVTSV
ncbi:hypothetical protein [Lentzea sp. NBRC 102530]|uniref:hypothetical protein n=1 Tax=Lentzea sp. NBRC 102530 TaxID=3032201 RepID=UPI0024A163C3|nr:hypothetical protein [Lentzea sp. NBRC 102530]GLY46611.1 hypothetical protein Lesp01_02670 [Lentzea sp. NBRC 102530]